MLKGKGYGNIQKNANRVSPFKRLQFNWTEQLSKGKNLSSGGLMNTKRENSKLRNLTFP